MEECMFIPKWEICRFSTISKKRERIAYAIYNILGKHIVLVCKSQATIKFR